MAKHNTKGRERIRKQLGERGDDFDRGEHEFPIYVAYRRSAASNGRYCNVSECEPKNELLVTMVGMRVMSTTTSRDRRLRNGTLGARSSSSGSPFAHIPPCLCAERRAISALLFFGSFSSSFGYWVQVVVQVVGRTHVPRRHGGAPPHSRCPVAVLLASSRELAR